MDQWAIYADNTNNITIESNSIMARGIGGIYLGNLSNATVINNTLDNIHPSVLAGVEFENCTNCVFDGNIVYGGEPYGQGLDLLNDVWPDYGMLVVGGSNNTISRGRFDGIINGIGINASNVTIKDIYISDVYYNAVKSLGTFDNITIEDCDFLTTADQAHQDYHVMRGSAIWAEGTANNVVIRNTRIGLWGSGPIHFTATPTFGNYPVIENNEMVDYNNLNFQVLESAPAPSVAVSSNWQTNNASPTTITDLVNAPGGKQVNIFFKDDNTTVNFSNSNLKGNNSQDWHPVSGDEMSCVKQNAGYWSCELTKVQ